MLIRRSRLGILFIRFYYSSQSLFSAFILSMFDERCEFSYNFTCITSSESSVSFNGFVWFLSWYLIHKLIQLGEWLVDSLTECVEVYVFRISENRITNMNHIICDWIWFLAIRDIKSLHWWNSFSQRKPFQCSQHVSSLVLLV